MVDGCARRCVKKKEKCTNCKYKRYFFFLILTRDQFYFIIKFHPPLYTHTHTMAKKTKAAYRTVRLPMNSTFHITIPSIGAKDKKDKKARMITMKLRDECTVTLPDGMIQGDYMKTVMNGGFKESKEDTIDMSSIPYVNEFPLFMEYFFDKERYMGNIRKPIFSKQPVKHYFKAKFLMIKEEDIKE